MSKVILSKRWFEALVRAGVVSRDEKIHRIVIDAVAGGVTRIYLERWADERLLDVALTLDGIKITGVESL
jgi:hypothetical protein